MFKGYHQKQESFTVTHLLIIFGCIQLKELEGKK